MYFISWTYTNLLVMDTKFKILINKGFDWGAFGPSIDWFDLIVYIVDTRERARKRERNTRSLDNEK